MNRSKLFGVVTLGGAILLANGCAGPGPEDGAPRIASSAVEAGGGLGGRARCAVLDPDPATQAAVESRLAQVQSQRLLAGRGHGDDRITIPVRFHVVTASDGTGDVSALVPAQLAVLNAAYAHDGIRFRLAGLEVVANDAWFLSEAGSVEEIAMKAALRRGGPNVLNVYTTLGDVYLGWATFPSDYEAFPLYDGVVLYYASLPGTGFNFPVDPSLEPDGVIGYDEGDTATHEVGHWLGLYHTFEGGCSNPGDHVSDTPAEAEPQFFCVERDSCTGRRFQGSDPIHNFMDYVDDACMYQFTRGQERRMRDQWDAFRDD
jgi:hypothetical protein